MNEHEYLVVYDYGMGGLWAVLIAPSADAITAKYPELTVVLERPPWMDEDQYERIRSEPLRIDDPPAGMLTAVVSSRGK